MQIAKLIPAVALLLLPLCAAFFLFRRSSLLKKLGNRDIAFPHRMQLQFIGILVCSPILIALNFGREFDATLELFLSGTGVFGFCVALADIILIRVGGVYEHGLVWNTAAILYDDVVSFSQIDPFSIEVVNADRLRRRLIFGNPELVPEVLSRLESAASPLP